MVNVDSSVVSVHREDKEKLVNTKDSITMVNKF